MSEQPGATGPGLKAANRNRSTPVTAVDGNGKLWSAQIEPFLEGEDGELFLCPADPNAVDLEGEERDPQNASFQPSFGANSQMHRMQGSDGGKIVLVDFGDGDDDEANDSMVHVIVPEGDDDTNWETNPNGQQAWDAAIDDAGDRHAGNVNVLRHDGSVSAESSDDLLENHPAQAGSNDWVPWRTGSDGDVQDRIWDAPASADASDIDTDGDGIANDQDNCPDTPNPNQADANGDGTGDACNSDDPDEDGILSAEDNCPNSYNPGQEDADADGTGDVCEEAESDTGDGGGEDSTPLEDEGCYQHGLGFPEVANLHVQSRFNGSEDGSGDGFVGPLRLDPNHFRFEFVSMGDCNGYELWYEDWIDWDYDMHFRFKRILTGPNAGKIQLSVRFYTEAKAHYYLYLDENQTPFPGDLAHYCNWDGYQLCGDNELQIDEGVWHEATVLFDGDLERPCTCPPAVDAGADASIPSLEYQLLGDATIDSTTGLPSQVYWTQVSGPEGVAFSDPTTLQPTAHFPGEGVYVLKLTGTADGKSSSDEIQVSIDSEATLYRYVRVKRVSSYGGVFLANVKIINNEGTDVAPMGVASCTTNGRAPENAISNPG